MTLLKLIFLYPLSVVYGIGVRLRNFLFDSNILKSTEFDIPVISIGNISVGGTGKTPATEYLVRLLKPEYEVAVLSRGYKRKTKGFVLADKDASVDKIGDEPYQIFIKFPDITVAVDEKRVRGIKKLLEAEKKPDLIILDDAFQHRYVKPGLSILLIDYTQPFFNDKYLPYGRLRDNPNERFRAEIVIVTKTPKSVKPIDMRITATDLMLKPYQALYFAEISYKEPIPVFYKESKHLPSRLGDLKDYDVLLISGIGNPKPFTEHCKSVCKSITVLNFEDHHKYTIKDLEKISSEFQKINSPRKIIITTEKDAVRLRSVDIKNEITKKAFFFCPIQMSILSEEKKEFEDLVFHFIKKTNAQHRFLTSKKKFY